MSKKSYYVSPLITIKREEGLLITATMGIEMANVYTEWALGVYVYGIYYIIYAHVYSSWNVILASISAKIT